MLGSVSVPVVGSLANAVLTAALGATQVRIVLKGNHRLEQISVGRSYRLLLLTPRRVVLFFGSIRPHCGWWQIEQSVRKGARTHETDLRRSGGSPALPSARRRDVAAREC